MEVPPLTRNSRLIKKRVSDFKIWNIQLYEYTFTTSIKLPLIIWKYYKIGTQPSNNGQQRELTQQGQVQRFTLFLFLTTQTSHRA